MFPFVFNSEKLQIPQDGSIKDILTSDIANGCHDVNGISSVDAMKDWGMLLVFKRVAFFKPLNIKNTIITFTRGGSAAEWDKPFKIEGTSI